MGGEVAKTIGKGVVHAEQYSADHDFYAIAMTAVLARAANSGGPGGPTGPLCTPFRTPWTLSRPSITH